MGNPALADRFRMLDSTPPELILHTSWRNLGVYGGVIIRSRYTEDRLAAAVARGIRQYVLIGAGLDSFALRRPDWARDLAIFEVDHPAAQENKKQRLADAAIAIPPGPFHFVPADLTTVSLAGALAQNGFCADQPAILSWLGVTIYLPREANIATLRSVASLAPQSELVFTYSEKRILDSDSPRMRRAKAAAAALGEPWICGFDPETFPAELQTLGLEILEDLGPQEQVACFCASRTDALSPGRAGRICAARVLPH